MKPQYEVTNISGHIRKFVDDNGWHVMRHKEKVISTKPPEDGVTFRVKPFEEKEKKDTKTKEE